MSRLQLTAPVRPPSGFCVHGGAVGPWWSALATPATRSPQLPGRRGRGGGLPTSEFLLPAEDLGELAQLLTGSLGLLLQPLVVLPQAGHLRLQHRLVLLLLWGWGGHQGAANGSPGPVSQGSAVVYSWAARVQSPALLLDSWVTAGKLCHLSGPRLPQL